MLWCPECEIEKAPEDFYIDRRRKSGRTSYCKVCTRQRNAESKARRLAGQAIQATERRTRKAPPASGEKRCPECQQVKPLSEFVRNRSTKSGVGGYCRPCQNVVGKRNTERLHGSTRTYHLKRRYGLTATEVQELIEEQRGVCWICRTRPAEHVDHDHETGMVRAILCFTCNVGLANFGEDIERMKAAIIYLEIFRAAARAQARSTA